MKRKQNKEENLEDFRHALNCLAGNFDFGIHTMRLYFDIFVSDLENVTVSKTFLKSLRKTRTDAQIRIRC